MRRACSILLLSSLAACNGNETKSNYTGLNVLARFDGSLPITSLHLIVTFDNGNWVSQPSDTMFMTPSPPVAMREEPLVVLLPASLDGKHVNLIGQGHSADGTQIATGTASANLLLGELVDAPMQLRPPAKCGDGVVDPGEGCDDGNTTAGDGCSDHCMVEPGFVCASEPSQCFLSSTVVFTDPGAGCPGDGSMTRPFCTISGAANAPRATAIVVRAGVYNEQIHLSGVRFTLLADKGAVLQSNASPTLTLDSRSVVSIDRLTVRGGATSGGGIVVSDQGTNVTLTRAQIGPSSALGVRVTSGAALTLERSLVTENSGGGLALESSAPYRVVNDIIVQNGTDTSSVGGVALVASPDGSKLVNDTIADNRMMNGARGAGVRCDVPAELINDIVWGNSGGPVSFDQCHLGHSDVGPLTGATPDLGTSFSLDPELTADFHIAPTSPCKDHGDPTGVEPQGVAPNVDYDGDPRPQGQAVDVGADEIG
jgi:cysteine-rich repeat protein